MIFRSRRPRSALHLLCNAAAGCSVAGIALLAEERRRRIALAQKLVENGRRLQAYKAYHGNAAIAVFDGNDQLQFDFDRTYNHNTDQAQTHLDVQTPTLTNHEWRQRGRSKRSLPNAHSSTLLNSSRNTSDQHQDALSLEQWRTRMHTVETRVQHQMRATKPDDSAAPATMAPSSLVAPALARQFLSETEEGLARQQTVRRMQIALRRGLASRLARAESESDRMKVYRELYTYFSLHDEIVSQPLQHYVRRLKGLSGSKVSAERNSRTWLALPEDMRTRIERSCEEVNSDSRSKLATSQASSVAMALQQEPVLARQRILSEQMFTFLNSGRIDEAHLLFSMGLSDLVGPLQPALRGAARQLIDSFKSLSCSTMVLEVHKGIMQCFTETSLIVEDIGFLLEQETASMRLSICQMIANSCDLLEAPKGQPNTDPLLKALQWLLEHDGVVAAAHMFLKLDLKAAGSSIVSDKLGDYVRHKAYSEGDAETCNLIDAHLAHQKAAEYASVGRSSETGDPPPTLRGADGPAAIDLMAWESFERYKGHFITTLLHSKCSGWKSNRKPSFEAKVALSLCLKSQDKTAKARFINDFGYKLLPLKTLERECTENPNFGAGKALPFLLGNWRRIGSRNDTAYSKMIHIHQQLKDDEFFAKSHPSVAKDLYIAYTALGSVPQMQQALSRLATALQIQKRHGIECTPRRLEQLSMAHSQLLTRAWMLTNNINMVESLFLEMKPLLVPDEASQTVFDGIIRACVEAKDWQRVDSYSELASKYIQATSSVHAIGSLTLAQAVRQDWAAVRVLLQKGLNSHVLNGDASAQGSAFDGLVAQFCAQHDAEQVLTFASELLHDYRIVLTADMCRRITCKVAAHEDPVLMSSWLALCTSSSSNLYIGDDVLQLVCERAGVSPKISDSLRKDNRMTLMRTVDSLEPEDMPLIALSDQRSGPDHTSSSRALGLKFEGGAGLHHENTERSTLPDLGSTSNEIRSVHDTIRAMRSAELAGDPALALSIYHDSLVGGLPLRPAILAMAASACISRDNGKTEGAMELIRSAEAAGARTNRARRVVLLHDIKTMPITEAEARSIVFDSYQESEQGDVPLDHQVLHAVLQRLAAQRQPRAALRICQQVQSSIWVEHVPLDIKLMTTLMSIFIRAHSISSIKWVHDAVMARMRPDKKYLLVLKQGQNKRDASLIGMTTLLSRLIEETKTKRAEQREQSKKFLVEFAGMLREHDPLLRHAASTSA